MNRLFCTLALLGLMLFGAGEAFADSITYTEQATATGTLGGSDFADALVTLTLIGDTSNAVNEGSGFFSNEVGTFTVDVAGIGTATFTDSMEVFVNQAYAPAAAGFAGGTVFGSVLATLDNALVTYDLTTAIGPITNTNFIRPDLTFGTTLGGLNIQSAGDATFTAALSEVPEPTSLLLLGTGLGALGLVARRRKR